MAYIQQSADIQQQDNAIIAVIFNDTNIHGVMVVLVIRYGTDQHFIYANIMVPSYI